MDIKAKKEVKEILTSLMDNPGLIDEAVSEISEISDSYRRRLREDSEKRRSIESELIKTAALAHDHPSQHRRRAPAGHLRRAQAKRSRREGREMNWDQAHSEKMQLARIVADREFRMTFIAETVVRVARLGDSRLTKRVEITCATDSRRLVIQGEGKNAREAFDDAVWKAAIEWSDKKPKRLLDAKKGSLALLKEPPKMMLVAVTALAICFLFSGCAIVRTGPATSVIVPWFLAPGPVGQTGIEKP